MTPGGTLHHIKEQTMEQITPTIQRRGLTMETDIQELALALKTYRLRKGLTQEQLANRWGCSRYTIMRIEAGKKTTWEMAYRVFNSLMEALRTEARQCDTQQSLI